MPRPTLPSPRRRSHLTWFSRSHLCREKDKPRFFRLLAEGAARRGNPLLMREALFEIDASPTDDIIAILDAAKNATPVYIAGELIFRIPDHRFLHPLPLLRLISAPTKTTGSDSVPGFVATLCAALKVADAHALPIEIRESVLILALATAEGPFLRALLKRLHVDTVPLSTMRDAVRLAFELGDGWRGLWLLRQTRRAFEGPFARHADTAWPAPTIRHIESPFGSTIEAAYTFPRVHLTFTRYDLFALTPLAPDDRNGSALNPHLLAQTRQFFRWCRRIVALDDALAAANT